jgi:hypothetical protein
VQAKLITALVMSNSLICGALQPVRGQQAPPPPAAAVIVAVDSRAVVESVDKQARQVLVHLPDDTLVTLNVPRQVKGIESLKPGDHVAVKYVDAAIIHLAKTQEKATAEPAAGEASKDQIHGVRTVVGINPSADTVTLADAKNHLLTLGVPDPSVLQSLHPGDNVDVAYREAVVISVEPTQV